MENHLTSELRFLMRLEITNLTNFQMYFLFTCNFSKCLVLVSQKYRPLQFANMPQIATNNICKGWKVVELLRPNQIQEHNQIDTRKINEINDKCNITTKVPWFLKKLQTLTKSILTLSYSTKKSRLSDILIHFIREIRLRA